MKNLGTTPASKNDSWSAYTHIEAAGRAFEIRHPWTEGTSAKSKFTIFRWNDQIGHCFWGSADTLEGAIDIIGIEEHQRPKSNSLVNAINL